MAESNAHIIYVRKIVTYLSHALSPFVGNAIQADLAEYGKRTPQVIGGYYPDVYYRTPTCFVIGEAKTDNDIENNHTESQINCYLDELRLSSQPEKHLVLSTSVYSYAMLKNRIVKKIENENIMGISIHIIDNISRSAIL